MRKGLKYSLLSVGGLLLLVVIVLTATALLIQTEPAKRKISSLAEKQSTRFLNGELQIGKIEGNFFTHLSINNILLKTENDTLASIEKIELDYSLWPLLAGKLDIHSAGLQTPRLFLRQNSDSVWNFQQLIKPGAEESETSEEPGSFEINLGKFKLTNGNIKTEALDTIIPKEISNLNSELSFQMTEESQELGLHSFTFSTRQPDFSMKQLKFNLTRDTDFIELRDFYVETGRNSMEGMAEIESDSLKNGTANFETAAFDISEFSYFLPSLTLPARPSVKLTANVEQNAAKATIQLSDQDQQILINAGTSNLQNYLSEQTDIQPDYQLTVDFKNVELGYWLNNPDLMYFLNGTLEANGRGFDPKTASSKISGQLNNWVIENRQIDRLNFKLNLKNGNVAGNFRGHGNFGSFNLVHNIQNFAEKPEYKLDLSTRNLNLARLTGIDSLYSNLNLQATATGTEFDPEKLNAYVIISGNGSEFQHIQIDSLHAAGNFKTQNINLDSLRLKTQMARIEASGVYSLTSNSDLQLSAEIDSLNEFSAYLAGIDVNTSGKLTASLYGRPDSLNLESNVELNSTRYGDILLEQLQLAATGWITKTDTMLSARIFAGGLGSGNLKVDSITANIDGNTDSLFLDARLQASELTTSLQTGIVPGEKTRFTLNSWETRFQDQQWKLQNAPATIEFDSVNYTLNNFRLASGNADSMQVISANGIISLREEEDFTLEISRLDIGKLSQLLELEYPVTSLFNAKINVSGNAQSPVLNARYSISDASLAGYEFTGFDGNLDYSENEFQFETNIFSEDSGKVELTAKLPVQVRLDSMMFGFNSNNSVNAQMNITNLSAAILQKMDIIDDFSGFLESEFSLSGTMKSPLANGNFSVNEANFRDYAFPKIDGNFNFRENQLSAESEIITEDDGEFNFSASLPVQYEPNSLSFKFNPDDSINGQVDLKNFSLAILETIHPSATINGQVNGEMAVTGTANSPQPEGNFRLADASFKLSEYGIDYEKIKLNLNFLRDRVKVDSFRIMSADGSLTGQGEVNFESELYKGDLSQSEIKLVFDKFNPFDHRSFNMQVSGNASLGGEKDNLVYGGNLNIPQAEIYLPAILRMMGKLNVPEMPKPILAREAEKLSLYKDSTTFTNPEPEPALTDSVNFEFLDKLRGRLGVKIPKNTWIKNDDMRIEISGDVELVKNGEFFELFGAVDVVRGQYDLLGKTFVIDDGTISFQGGEEMMPTMNITASYRFRNAQRAEQVLTVNISGTAESPEVSFKLDDSSISEGDALSYIIFGKSMNELTIDEQNNVAGAGGGSLAGKAAASILSSQITNFLGDKLNVDYIEVKSDGSFDNATVVVGKYITNDLFVSYEQRFGETDETNMAKYEVKLEYELFRFLFFELNNSSNDSGFDVILKFDME
ncbi:Autotransporter translocation and assembly factor TamB [Tangfeifania diversioriginum]|uniref:Autotransporter translocation and assembly factor TamB n=1 Tax=Tangfeifania diversioriginum TaxID=1168035 RepID=A0A1M6B6Q1_9BACT|nr:translocation/assembly module TamB [Tangfeifania diversioriginum]SHI44327.1 Autotransporter translocation and assembly factor TamB [Tangfeifania diversioriginum]